MSPRNRAVKQQIGSISRQRPALSDAYNCCMYMCAKEDDTLTYLRWNETVLTEMDGCSCYQVTRAWEVTPRRLPCARQKIHLEFLGVSMWHQASDIYSQFRISGNWTDISHLWLLQGPREGTGKGGEFSWLPVTASNSQFQNLGISASITRPFRSFSKSLIRWPQDWLGEASTFDILWMIVLETYSFP